MIFFKRFITNTFHTFQIDEMSHLLSPSTNKRQFRAGFLRISVMILIASVLSCPVVNGQSDLKFDFGTAKPMNGYEKVDALSKYSDAKGYGFDYGSQVIAIDRSDKNANSNQDQDFCTSIGSMFFSVKLPQGIYRVTVHLGDPWRNSLTTIKAESRRLMVKEIATKAGESKTVSFLVSIWDSVINDRKVVKLKPREVDKMDWDNKLTLEFNNERPCVDAVEIEKVDAAETVNVFLIGNSTVTDQQLEPWACWGQMIPNFFSSDKVAFTNMAASGETLRSSFQRGRLSKIASMLKPGDYLFIEFAHNDQKPGSGEIAYTSYNEYLRTYIDSARAHGATAVLVTSTNRRSFDKSGKIVNTLGEFPDAMRFEAKKQHLTLIDLNAMTKTLYEAYGESGSKALFVQYPKGSFPDQDTELADNTHFSNFGAYELAKCILEGIKASKLPLRNDIKKDLKPFNPASPDAYKNFSLPFTPLFTSVKPYGN